MKALVLILVFLSPIYLIAQTYTEVSNAIGINHSHAHQWLMGGGCAFFDYNGDGKDDLYLSGGNDRDYLYRNDGNGTFTEVGLAAGLGLTSNYYTFGITTGDIDNDGDRDLFLTTFTDGEDTITGNKLLLSNNKLFLNNGNGTFTDNSIAAGIVDSSLTTTASFGDFNKDGFLDIYVTNYLREDGPIEDSLGNLIGVYAAGLPNYLYINNGDGTFTQDAASWMAADTGCGLAVTVTDYDNDNDPDVYVANDFGEWNRPNVLYQNNYPGTTFSDVSAGSGADIGLFGMGIAVGDYNEDLYLDYYITNIGRNFLLHNNGDGTFTDTTTYAQVENEFVDTLLTTGWGAAFFDYDNDTYLDLFVANGHMDMAPGFRSTHLEDPNKLYHNNGDGTFTDTTDHFNLGIKTLAHGMAYSDFDEDGDIDMAVAVIDFSIPSDSMPHTLVYRNDGIGINNNWIQVNLQGTVSNRDAFGAHVLVYAGGRTFLREVDGGSSHASQNSSVQHIGLGTISSVDSVVVVWPNTGREAFTNLAINQRHQLIEGNLTNLTKVSTTAIEVYPNPTHALVNIDYAAALKEPVDVLLYDNLGQLVYQITVNTAKATIDLKALDLPQGVYQLTIKEQSYPIIFVD